MSCVAHTTFLPLQLLPPCTYKLTDVTFAAGEEGFQWGGVTVTSPGFTSAMPWKAIDTVECPAAFRKGDLWEMKEVWPGMGGWGQRNSGCDNVMLGGVLSHLTACCVLFLCSGVCEGAGDHTPWVPNRE